MAKLGISTGTTPDDGTGDSLLDGAVKINSNFDEIYTFFGDGTNLTGAGVTYITAGSGISVDQNTGNVTITATGGGGGGETYWAQNATGINTTSNVGIGTTTASSTLTVKGDTSLETLSVSGVSTFPLNVSVGVDFLHQGDSVGKVRISGDGTYGNGRLAFYNGSNNDVAVWDSNLSTGSIDIYNYTNSGTQNITISAGSSVVLQHGGTNTKLQTLGAGVTVTGTTFTNQLSVSGVSTLGTVQVSSGIITATSGIVTYYGDVSNAADGRWTLGANGTSDYTFTGIGFTQTSNDPVLYLARGRVYEFVNNSGGSHPFEIRLSNGGSAYNDGVTNNASASGTIRFVVPFNAPNTLYYQCTVHSGMGNTISVYPNLFT